MDYLLLREEQPARFYFHCGLEVEAYLPCLKKLLKQYRDGNLHVAVELGTVSAGELVTMSRS